MKRMHCKYQHHATPITCWLYACYTTCSIRSGRNEWHDINRNTVPTTDSWHV